MAQDAAKKLGELEAAIQTAEIEARSHEDKARSLRAQRSALRSELAELQNLIMDARRTNAAQQAMEAAQKSQQHAESAATDVRALKDELMMRIKESQERDKLFNDAMLVVKRNIDELENQYRRGDALFRAVQEKLDQLTQATNEADE